MGITLANEVWGKVMFLHLSVILFTNGSLYDVTSCLAAWSHVPLEESLCLVHVPSSGVSVPGPMFLLRGVITLNTHSKTGWQWIYSQTCTYKAITLFGIWTIR